MVKRVAPSLSDETVRSFINHLLSDEVGVATLDDLKDVEQSMFPPNINIPALKRKQLLAAFAAASNKPGKE